jgi:hypothetical protein
MGRRILSFGVAAICAVLKSPGDASLKKHVRDSILAAVGPWRFTTPTQTRGTTSAGAN